MCTVTFIPVKDGFFITSNRDEKKQRTRALSPDTYQVNNVQLLFPRDADAGGTWIAVKDHANAAVLLNGAFVFHFSKPPYRRSRGLILLDILSAADPLNFFASMDLKGIEPFTLILLQDAKLFECRWDGEQKHCTELAVNKSHIWSSATLYNEAISKKRATWFKDWLSNCPEPTQEDIFNFHQFAGDGDIQNDIRMNRDGNLFTVSITGSHLGKQTVVMSYLDLKDGSRCNCTTANAIAYSIS